MIGIDISGVTEVQQSMARYASDAGQKFEKTLLVAGLIIQAEAQSRTPVDTSLLRNSARTQKKGLGFNTEVLVSFSTSYAVFVHEIDIPHAIGEAFFLERAITAKKKDLVELFTKVFT